MIFDTSYTDKRITQKINQAVGNPFSWKIRWKLGGIGSRRMTIKDISDEYKKYLNAAHYISNGNIELRPKGIIIHFRHKLQAYSWIMPYEQLQIDSTEQLRLKADNHFITFEGTLDEPFIVKMSEQFEQFRIGSGD